MQNHNVYSRKYESPGIMYREMHREYISKWRPARRRGPGGNQVSESFAELLRLYFVGDGEQFGGLR